MLAAACGGEEREAAEPATKKPRYATKGTGTATGAATSPRLYELDDGQRILGLQPTSESGCFGVAFSYEEEGGVQFGDSGCFGRAPWHVAIGIGGRPGSVGWTLVVGATKPEVDRVIVTAGASRHEVEPESVPGWGVNAFRLGLDAAVSEIAAYGSRGTLLEKIAVPPQAERPCDWICEGEGQWGRQFDVHQGLRRPERDPDIAILAADREVRTTLEGAGFTLFHKRPWGGCAGVERGGSWTFMLDEESQLPSRVWPTVDEQGRPLEVRGTASPEMIVVDVDLDRNRVVSILPYTLSSEPLVDVTPRAAPLATAVNNEEPQADTSCRRLY